MGEGALCPAAICKPKSVIFVGQVLRGRLDDRSFDASFQRCLLAPGFQDVVERSQCRPPCRIAVGQCRISFTTSLWKAARKLLGKAIRDSLLDCSPLSTG